MFLWLHGACGEARSRGGRQAPGKDGLRRLTCLPSQHGNFEESQETMKRQLGQLLLLLRVLDPPLCDFLGMCLGAGAAGTKVVSESLGMSSHRRCPGRLVLILKRETSGNPEPKTYLGKQVWGFEQTSKCRCACCSVPTRCSRGPPSVPTLQGTPSPSYLHPP